MKILISLIFLFTLWGNAEAVTRYAIPGPGATGCSNGSTTYNPATNTCGAGSSTVYTTLAACLNSFGLTAGAGAGHACAVRAGTYVETLINSIPGGTSASARFEFYCYDTLYSCRIDPGTHGTDVIRFGVVNQKHIRVRYFELDARGQNASQNILSHANSSNHTGIVLERNWFRGGANSGPCIATAETNGPIQILYNLIEGCMGAPTGGSGSHAIYIKATSGIGSLIEGNVIQDNYSHALHCYPTCNGVTFRKNFVKNNGARCLIMTQGSGGIITDNIFVANSSLTGDSECIRINSHDNAKVYNNLIYNHTGSDFRISIEGIGAIVRNNICSSGTCVSGTATTSDNITGNPGFTNTATDDYSLTSAATTAINEGTNISGFLYNGTNRDIGPFETFVQGAAVVTGNTMDLGFNMNLNVPLLPATGMTGFTVNNGRTVTSAVRLSDSVVRLTFSGAACTDGQTWTYSYSGGNVTDSALIGGSKNQPLHSITNQSVTNNCTGGAVPGTFSQASYQWNLLYKDLAGNLTKLPSPAAPASSAIRAASGAVLALEIQTNCDNVADCTPIGQVLQYDVNSSGSWAAVTDTCGQTCFYGTADTNAAVPSGAPTCPISGALTCVDGGTQRTASAIPIIDMGQNNSTVNRYLIKIMPEPKQVFRFRLINQNGTEHNYNPNAYPTVTGISPTAGVGM